MSVFRQVPLALLVFGGVVATSSLARASDRLNNHPWDYQVRGAASATHRATVMWQADQADGAAGQAGFAAGSAGTGGLPAVGSVANMTLITVVVGDNSVVDVAVEAEQQNSGPLNANATSVVATGGIVDLGSVAPVGNTVQAENRP